MSRLFRPLIFTVVVFCWGLTGMNVRADDANHGTTPVSHVPAHDFLVGLWRNDGPIPVEGTQPGQVEIEMTTRFDADGAMYGRGTMRFPPEPGYEHVERSRYQLASQGSWIVRPGVGNGHFRLHGTGQLQTSSPDTDFSVTEDWVVAHDIRILDANTYLDSDGVRWLRIGLTQSH